ncbi:hypothetical protein C8T65DRAFT_678580 [Cerioporus squamosus]|nr:hypothetical protein C8T65DRAFT_678580 [Cerioporus squamosus]
MRCSYCSGPSRSPACMQLPSPSAATILTYNGGPGIRPISHPTSCVPTSCAAQTQDPPPRGPWPVSRVPCPTSRSKRIRSSQDWREHSPKAKQTEK